MSDWKAGAIMIATPEGRHALPGYVNPPFGLEWGIDFMSGGAVWVVHHLPTGYCMFAVDHEIGDVLQLIDLLKSLGDWSFSDPARCQEFSDTISIVQASGFTIRNPKLVRRPTGPIAVAETAA